MSNTPMSPSFTKTQYNFFLILFIGTAVILFYICRPFINALVLAGSFAIVFYPLYERLCRWWGNRRNLAALATVIFILIVVLVPLILIGGLLFNEARDLYTSLASKGDISVISQLVGTLEKQVRVIAPDATLNVAGYVQSGLQWLVNHLDTFFSGFLSILISTFIMVIALFFLLRDGRTFRDTIFMLSPLGREYDEGITSKLILAVNSVVKGSLVIAVVQGIFASIGFVLVGLPNPIIWGVAAMFASLIPGVGTSLVTVPAIIFLIITRPLGFGIGLLLWSVFGIGLIDNFLTPYVLNRGIQIHPFFILISVLGGIAFFGPIGFIIGPVVLAFFFALVDIYPRIMHQE